MMVSVRDLSWCPLAGVMVETTVDQALEALLSAGVNQLYVTDQDGMLAGVVTDYDLFKAQLTRTVAGERVERIMNRCPACVAADEPVAAVAGMFREARYAQLAVVDRGRLVGVIGRGDVMRLLRSLEQIGMDLACGAAEDSLDANNAMRGPRYMQTRNLMAEQSTGSGM